MSKRARARPVLADWHLWAEVKRTVTPLRPEQPERDLARQLTEETLPIPAAKPPPVFDKAAGWSGPTLPAYHPPASGKRRTEPGRTIEPRVKRRLMRGTLAIDGTIDLHGMRQDEAREALRRFVAAGAARGDRTLLVITGKGSRKTAAVRVEERGVLRAMLPIWLGEPGLAPLIAGWDVSAQGHGGEGAYYVRLRRVMR